MLNSRKFGLFAIFLCGLVFGGVFVPKASGILLVYDGFDYLPGALNGLTGGSGFSGAWTEAAGGSTIAADGLSYQDSNGNVLQVTGGRVISSAAAGNANPIRDIVPADGSGGNPIGWQAGTTWWSGIGRRLQPHPTLNENVIRASGVQIHDAVGATAGLFAPNERLSVGKGTTAAPAVTYNWGLLHSGNVANQVNSNAPITETAFFVVRIDHLGTTAPGNPGGLQQNDNAYLWINPTLDSEPQIGTHDVEFLGLNELSISRAAAFIGGANASGPYADFTWDEYRLATTWQEAMPFGPGTGGDYNQNGIVDTADYTVWRNNLGAPAGTLPNDADGGVIGPAQYNTWKANFGTIVGRPGPKFSIRIDQSTGAGTLVNNSAEALEFDHYILRSELGNLSTNWAGIDGATAPGVGWDRAGGSDASQLIELYLPEEDYLVPALGELPLGVVLNSLAGIGTIDNYSLEVQLAGGAIVVGAIELVGLGGAGAADPQSAVVPEPASLVLLAIAVAIFFSTRRESRFF